ncbi:CubicO group peptidase, beta-lactamase class C family [Flavobacterium micromati]|uniref:CubicO group peptidase, beta-lactamase class C family n=1 Tax=Flavobacterium micromati TaxID=229205 RepID=A0A1M5N124_9FLAO|nr:MULTISPECIES: serine hydrolase [Flavobacterium]MBG6062300.1 CubicO group peptidase (beta-lactamase class C family) [Flavobacterium sp. CG_9.1]MCL6462018.1 serine hydrolase [Flavobacterium micromati]SHG83155.1 CubicO group peptidase, beta-lactamase class C family [Flavobacterium micromati]
MGSKISILLLAIVILGISSCDVYHTLRFGALPDQNDFSHFPKRKIENQDSVFNFIKPAKDYNLGKLIGLTNKSLNASNIALDSFAKIHNTISFLIIRNDTILYEKYNGKYSDTSLVSSFSMVKPMVSTLVGIAISEGKIKSKEDPIINYLTEFKNKPGFDKITVKNLLQHTSGIKFTDQEFNIVSDNAEFYWGHDLRRDMKELTIKTAPNTEFHYSSANTQLLALIIERITNKPVSNYLETKIWKPLGMEAPAYWSLDKDNQNGMEKAFCCLQARTIDFAKFGRLYLNKGSWEGNQIVSRDWVEYSTHSDPSNNNRHFYNNNWGIGPVKYNSFYAVGLYGQYLYIYPEKNIQIIRFGNSSLSYNPNYWQDIFIQIIDQLNVLK